MRLWGGLGYDGIWLILFFLLLFFFSGCGWRRWGRWGGGCCGSGHWSPPTGPADPASGGDSRAVDPVCGMWVDKRTARRLSVDGQDYFFCSEACQKKFEAMRPRS
ncbi:MAG: YHS domain-containing protein [Bacillota bacterium]|nr:YHS domain-containing protein [Bacillota bacterium]